MSVKMKRIELVIDPSSFDRFREVAGGLNLSNFDLSEVRRTLSSSNRERQRLYRGREFVLDLVDRLKVEMTVADDGAMRIAHELNERVRPESIVISRLDNEIVLNCETPAQPARIAAVSSPLSLVAAH